MTGGAISTWCFSVAIVRRGCEFLLVHERKHGQGWYLPAGRVEPGETFAEAAVRETLEETGVPVLLKGIFRVEHTPQPHGQARCRVIFLAEPSDGTPPKSKPDEESLGAAWVSVNDAAALPLRDDEQVLRMLRDVERGAPLFPLTMVQVEGLPLLDDYN